MKISIFRDVTHLPKSTQEKRYAASKCVNPTVMDIETPDQLVNILANWTWSPSVFNGNRSMENFQQCDFMALDIDSGLRIEEAKKRCEEYNLFTLAMPSTSFTEENHKYRLVFPLSKTIKNGDDFRATWKYLSELFEEADPQCKDSARFYFGSRKDNSFMVDGDLLVPRKGTPEVTVGLSGAKLVKTDMSIKDIITKLYGQEREQIPQAVNYFFSNAETGLDGEWICSLNAAVFSLAISRVDMETVVECVNNVAPYELDERDMETIERAYIDGSRVEL